MNTYEIIGHIVFNIFVFLISTSSIGAILTSLTGRELTPDIYVLRFPWIAWGVGCILYSLTMLKAI